MARRKIRSTWRMTPEARKRLEELAQRSNRDMTNVLETLVLDRGALSVLIGRPLDGGPHDGNSDCHWKDSPGAP